MKRGREEGESLSGGPSFSELHRLLLANPRPRKLSKLVEDRRPAVLVVVDLVRRRNLDGVLDELACCPRSKEGRRAKKERKKERKKEKEGVRSLIFLLIEGG